MDDYSAREIAEGIMQDLSDRSGLGDELEIIDEEVREEILASWISIIQEVAQ